MTLHIVGWQGDKQSAVSASSPMVYQVAGEHLNNFEWYQVHASLTISALHQRLQRETLHWPGH